MIVQAVILLQEYSLIRALFTSSFLWANALFAVSLCCLNFLKNLPAC